MPNAATGPDRLVLEQDRQQVERLAARLSRAEQHNAVLRDTLARLVHTVREAIPDAGPAGERLRFALDTIPAALLNTKETPHA